MLPFVQFIKITACGKIGVSFASVNRIWRYKQSSLRNYFTNILSRWFKQRINKIQTIRIKIKNYWYQYSNPSNRRDFQALPRQWPQGPDLNREKCRKFLFWDNSLKRTMVFGKPYINCIRLLDRRFPSKIRHFDNRYVRANNRYCCNRWFPSRLSWRLFLFEYVARSIKAGHLLYLCYTW